MMRPPPLLGRLLLRLWRLGGRRDEIESDLLELMERRAERHGPTLARWRYTADALSLCRIRRVPDVIGDPEPSRGIDAMINDILFALRLFRRHPALYGVTIAGLALAIAISAAMFSIVRSIAFAGPGVAEPESLYRVSLASGSMGRITGDSPQFGDWDFASYQRVTEDVQAIRLAAAVSDRAGYLARVDAGGVPVTYRAVTGNYFGLLGLRAERGRILLPTDDRPQLRNAVVSGGFWRNVMGADPGVLGRTVVLDDEPFTIVGILDRRFSGPPATRIEPSFWITTTAHGEIWSKGQGAEIARTRGLLAARLADPALTPGDRTRLSAVGGSLSTPPRPWNPAVEVLGRLRPAVATARAEAELIASGTRRAAEASSTRAVVVSLEPAVRVRRDTKMAAAFLLTIVALVVALACANVTNVLLASAAGRRREIGTRLAIGASRVRIVRQLLTESVLLGVAASALGVLIGRAAVPVFSRLMSVPVSVDVSPDQTVYGFVGLVTIMIGVLAGFAPARYGGRGDIIGSLRVDQFTAPLPLPRARLRSILVGGQAAISVVLLVLAALLTRSLADNVFADVGYDIDRLVVAGLGTSGAPAPSPERHAHWARLREHALAVPGVAAAALVAVPPFEGSHVPQRLNGIRVNRNETTAEYFETLGIRTLRGRTYTADETRDGAPVVVVSASLARTFWGSEDPVGQGMERVWGAIADAENRKGGLLRKIKDARVIGVVADTTSGLESKDVPTIYLPMSADAAPRLIVRAATTATGGLLTPLRDAIQRFDPRQRPVITRPADGLRRALERPASLTMLAGAVGAIALGLAVIGLFGVTSFVVEQRTHEMSVRRALGATGGQLVALLLRDNLRPVAIGLTLGVLTALAGGRMIQAVLYGTSSRDPIALIAACTILAAASAIAVLVPARKAARIDPARLLKQG